MVWDTPIGLIIYRGVLFIYGFSSEIFWKNFKFGFGYLQV